MWIFKGDAIGGRELPRPLNSSRNHFKNNKLDIVQYIINQQNIIVFIIMAFIQYKQGQIYSYFLPPHIPIHNHHFTQSLYPLIFSNDFFFFINLPSPLPPYLINYFIFVPSYSIFFPSLIILKNHLNLFSLIFLAIITIPKYLVLFHRIYTYGQQSNNNYICGY